MSAINVRLPESLHESLRELAKRDNVSINQFILVAISEKLSALMTEDYLEERAARGKRALFDAALAAILDVAPEDHDVL